MAEGGNRTEGAWLFRVRGDGRKARAGGVRLIFGFSACAGMADASLPKAGWGRSAADSHGGLSLPTLMDRSS